MINTSNSETYGIDWKSNPYIPDVNEFLQWSNSYEHYLKSKKGSSPSDLLCYHNDYKYLFQLINSRSVRNKVDIIAQSIIDSKCLITAITETWLTDKDTALSSQLIPQGYNITIANRSIPCRGGGLILIYSSKLKLVSTTIPSFSSCEMMICNLKFPSSCTIYFVLIYCPPSFPTVLLH